MSASTTKLYIARHGQTRLNREYRFQGRVDEPLDQTGFEQAEDLAARLPGDVTCVVASPLLRALQTAACVTSQRGLPLTVMEDFIERDYGVFDGLTREEIEARYADLWARKVVRQWDDAPPGAETMRAVASRVNVGLQRLVDQRRGETILLVCHGFVTRMLVFLLSGLPDDQVNDLAMIGNGEFVSYEIDAQLLARLQPVQGSAADAMQAAQ